MNGQNIPVGYMFHALIACYGRWTARRYRAGDARWFTWSKRHLRGRVRRRWLDAHYAALPPRRLRLVAARPAAPQPASTITPRWVYYQIARAIQRHATAACAPLAFAASCAYDAAATRSEERQYARAALQVRHSLVDAACLQPGGAIPAICGAIEALLHGELTAALGHLARIEHPAGVGRQPATEGAKA